ncbi:hypothetical protein NRD16_000765 [Photobacterium damselae]|nr:hypothetical protein [Photobacterium damselae]
MKPSEEEILRYMNELKFYFKQYAKHFHDPDMTADSVARSIDESIGDFNIIKRNEKENAFKRFIPIPDENKNGKDVWLLPNLSSFNSIYARINKYKKGKLSDVVIVHEEQVQFDEVITEIHEELGSVDGLMMESTTIKTKGRHKCLPSNFNIKSFNHY